MLRIERPVAASAAEFHDREVPDGDDVLVWWFESSSPALILGSTQSEVLLNVDRCRERGVDVVKRRSGGGLVFVSSRHTLWVDVIVPRKHPAWKVDVGRASEWIGEVWLDALSPSSVDVVDRPLSIHRGGQEATTWSKLICFAGRGPGEIFDDRGRKVVGISQRRTRAWARFQCALSLRWEPSLFVDLIPDGPTIADVEHAGFDVGSGFDVERVRDSFTESLASALSSAESSVPLDVDC